MKKIITLFLTLGLIFPLTACGGTAASGSGTAELHIFAASSMTETLDQVLELYKAGAPTVTAVPTYDSSGTLLTQIQAGADCDVFLSASPRQMNTLDSEGGLLEGTRLDLLENKITLAVPDGNPRNIKNFHHLAELLKSGGVLLAIGNRDVPVGQYTQAIFAFCGLDEAALAASGALTYGSNVKEVTMQVAEGAVDCGIIYATDALSAGLTVVDEATAEMCGQVIYPAAVLKNSAYPEDAKSFLDFLSTAEARAVFQSAGFTPLPC